MGSPNSFAGRPRAAVDFSHSRAIRTNPDDISFTRAEVETASSISKTGSDLGSNWIEKVTWPRRWPKSVPVTFRPSDGVGEGRVGMESQRRVGRNAGKERRLRRDRTRVERPIRRLKEAAGEDFPASGLSEEVGSERRGDDLM